jgi:hypothetical protein
MHALRTWTIEATEPRCCLCLSESRVPERIIVTLIDRDGESTIELDKDAWETLTAALADFRWATTPLTLRPVIKPHIPHPERILTAA